MSPLDPTTPSALRDSLRTRVADLTTDNARLKAELADCQRYVDMFPEVKEQCHTFRVERDALKLQVAALERTQAVCHCGTLVKDHDSGDGHSPVEMRETCHCERERDQLRILLRQAMLGHLKCTCSPPAAEPGCPWHDAQREWPQDDKGAKTRARP